MLSRSHKNLVALAMFALPAVVNAQAPAMQSAQIADIRYAVRFDRQTATSKSLAVSMTFTTTSAEAVLLSLPSWTPGAYEISDFARNVSGFSATIDGESVRWDKADYDTWRVSPTTSGSVTVSYSYLADSLDNAMAWAQPLHFMNSSTCPFLSESLTWTAHVSTDVGIGWLRILERPSKEESGRFCGVKSQPW